MFTKTTYNLKNIQKSEFVAYTHLGLGDHIICNGLLNYFSKQFDKIYIPVKGRDLNNLKYLYKNNSKIKIFEIDAENEKKEIVKFANKKNLQILKVGFKKRKPPFNLSFYQQFNLPYNYSVEYFSLPENKKFEDKLFSHLMGIYEIEKEYQLVHNQSSYGKVKLNINPDLPVVYVDKDTDIFNNMFYYTKVINNSKEIHCLDSSFLHLVERIDTYGKLYFHKIKKENQVSADVKLLKNWREINYIT